MPRAPGAKLPKLEVPTFNGDILKCKSFWDQLSVSIHKRSDLTAAETCRTPSRIKQLRALLRDSQSQGSIMKQSNAFRHDTICPRMIHQTHVCRIVEAPSLRDGTGKELRTVHDTVVQHLRALKALGHEPSKEFITSLLELKLDSVTMFEWQRHSQEHTDVPDCDKLLEFIDLRAQATEATIVDKKARGNHPPPSNIFPPLH